MHTYMSDAQLAERYGVHRVTIWRWSANGILPAPVRISAGCTRWLKDEIEARDAERQGEKQSRRRRRIAPVTR